MRMVVSPSSYHSFRCSSFLLPDSSTPLVCSSMRGNSFPMIFR